MFYSAGCLLSIPEPPLFDLSRCAAPAPAHMRWSHHMSPTHETRGMGRGVNRWDFSSHKNNNYRINEWLSRVVACSRDGVLRAWHIICDVVSELVTRVWRKQDRSDHLICCIVTRSITYMKTNRWIKNTLTNVQTCIFSAFSRHISPVWVRALDPASVMSSYLTQWPLADAGLTLLSSELWHPAPVCSRGSSLTLGCWLNTWSWPSGHKSLLMTDEAKFKTQKYIHLHIPIACCSQKMKYSPRSGFCRNIRPLPEPGQATQGDGVIRVIQCCVIRNILISQYYNSLGSPH